MKTIISILAFMLCSVMAWSQSTITGTVTDENGDPVIGATVRVDGTNTATITDLDGVFSIDANAEDVLVISYVGYGTQRVPAGNNTSINIALASDNLLDEVVVTAFGIEKDEKSLGYSVQEVDISKVDKAGHSNPFEALQGRVSGLQIGKTSGEAGAGVDMLIRGVSSVNIGRSNQPLIIVDGVTMNNDTFVGNVLPSAGTNATGSSEQFAFSNRAADINPEDVATINVLKGAAATALYGIRASNGAIVITTKRGQKGKPKVGFQLSTAMRHVVQTPELQKTYREGHRTTKVPTLPSNTSPTGYIVYPNSFPFYSWGVPYTDDTFVHPTTNEVLDLSNDRFISPYEFFRTGVNYNANFSLSGAGEHIDYLVSVGRKHDDGIVPNTTYKKNNVRLKGGFQIADNLKVTPSITYVGSGGGRGNGGDKSIYSSMSYWSPTFDINDYLLPDGRQKNYSRGVVDNPRYFAETSGLKDDVYRWIGSVNIDFSPFSWLDLTYQGQIDHFDDNRNRFVPAELDVGTQVGGFVVNEDIYNKDLESNLLATFKHDINTDIGSSLTLGHQVSDRRREYNMLRGQGLIEPFINDLSNTTNLFDDFSLRRQREVGLFGELNLDFNEILFLTLTGRNDWISTMPKKNRSFFYPSASAAFVFGDLIDPNGGFLSFGKLRSSYAQVGKGPGFGRVGRYYFKDDSNFPWDDSGIDGYRFGTVEGDLNLTPERSNSFEIGADLRFLDNRLRLDYTYYLNNVTNQIFRVGSAYSSGLSGNIRNAGDFELWGHEVLLGGEVVRGNDFGWDMNFNFSTTDSELTAIPEDLEQIVYFDDRITNKAKVGDALGSLYGWVYQTAPDGQRYVGSNGKWVTTGHKNSGYYYTNANETVKVGNAFPDFILSNNQTISWKDISLNFLVEWKKGGDLYDRGRRNSIRNGNLKITEFRDQEKILEGVMDDGSGGYVKNNQSITISGNNFYRDWRHYNNAAEVLLQDGSWLKLRTLGLGYSIPEKVVSKIGMRTATLQANANNIILWTPFDGFDPEGSQFSAASNIYGYTGLATPLSQSYSLGLNVTF